MLSTTGETGNPGNGAPRYSWSPTNYLDNPTSANPVLSNAPAGFTTNYTVTVMDASNCMAMASVTVRVSTLGANAGASVTIPVAASTNLGGMPTASGGTGPYTYSWLPITYLDDPTSTNPVATPLTDTTYTVTVTDSIGCTATSSITVNVVIGPFAAASLAGPQLHIRVLDASRVLLSWDGEYHLQMATNLSDSGASMAWANVHTNVVAGVNQVTNTVAGRGAFFRLRSP